MVTASAAAAEGHQGTDLTDNEAPPSVGVIHGSIYSSAEEMLVVVGVHTRSHHSAVWLVCTCSRVSVNNNSSRFTALHKVEIGHSPVSMATLFWRGAIDRPYSMQQKEAQTHPPTHAPCQPGGKRFVLSMPVSLHSKPMEPS